MSLQTVLAGASAAFLAAHAAEVARRAASDATWRLAVLPYDDEEQRRRRKASAQAALPRVLEHLRASVSAGTLAFCTEYGDEPDEVCYLVPGHVVGGANRAELGHLLTAEVPGLRARGEDEGYGPGLVLSWRHSAMV